MSVATRLVTGLFRISTPISFFLFCAPRETIKAYASALVALIPRQIRLCAPRSFAAAFNSCNPDSYLSEYRNRMVAVADTAAPRHTRIVP